MPTSFSHTSPVTKKHTGDQHEQRPEPYVERGAIDGAALHRRHRVPRQLRRRRPARVRDPRESFALEDWTEAERSIHARARNAAAATKRFETRVAPLAKTAVIMVSDLSDCLLFTQAFGMHSSVICPDVKITRTDGRGFGG